MSGKMDAATAITKARVGLLLDSPFFGTLALRLRLVDGQTDTMATDGESLFYSPEFVASLPAIQLRGVIAHEVMHCAMQHHARMAGRDHETWNVAADHAINHIIMDSGLQLPPDALLDSQYHGMSAEEIYGKVSNQPKKQKQGSGKPGSGKPGKPGWGEVRPAPGKPGKPGTGNGTGNGEAEQTWKVAVAQAAQAAKSRGKLPAGLARLVDTIIAPERPWRDLLREYVTTACRSRDDYTWSRPSRKSAAYGCYLPSMKSERLGAIAVVVDTSGSIGTDTLAEFTAEIGAISGETGATIYLAACDAACESLGRFEPGESLPTEFPGGGGTDFRPGIEWAESEIDEPVACIIYLTDGYGTAPDMEPSIPAIWVLTRYHMVPADWGKVVRL